MRVLTTSREPRTELLLVERRIAEPLLAREDSPQIEVQVVLPGEADAAEDLERVLDGRARRSRDVGFRDRRRLRRIGRPFVERRGGVQRG